MSTSMTMLEFLQMAANTRITKQMFGEMVHSEDKEERDRALRAMEMAGGYDNLED